MKIVYAKHDPYWDTGHLGDVVADMKERGTPTIRVQPFSGGYFALEGSHRLAAAHYLGLEPKLVIEIADGDDALDAFWANVAPTLPAYEFKHVHVLKLEGF